MLVAAHHLERDSALGEEGMRKHVAYSLEMADYAIELLMESGILAWRHENSFPVVFPNPGPEVISRRQTVPSGIIAHLVTMPHNTPCLIEKVTAAIIEALRKNS